MVDNYSIPSMLHFILTLLIWEKHWKEKGEETDMNITQGSFLHKPPPIFREES